MNFGEAENYLFSLGNEVSAMKLGLENIRTLLKALGEPHNNYLKVQVAGTNGKGSVCAFLNSVCCSAAIDTGLYTSPHLVSITERIKINGADISEHDFAQLATTVRKTAERLLESGELEYRPTFFEQMTAIALVAFANAKVQLSILETGLGGRLDATTAANAEIAAITSIDLDHQEYLGETLAEIAAEKAAIIKADSKVLVVRQKTKAEQVIIERCRSVGVEPKFATTDITTITNDDEIRQTRFRTEKDIYSQIALGLQGKHQEENAALAISIAEELKAFAFTISNSDIVSGLEQASHPGRLEWIGNFLFDGAHNPAGARALREYLDEFVQRPITMIFGAMQGKDVEAVAHALFPAVENLILTQPSNSRTIKPEALLEVMAKRVVAVKVFIEPDVQQAIDLALNLRSEHGRILVTGSLYLIGEVKKIMNSVSEI